MFLRSTTRKKDGKEHRYFSVVENRRVSRGRVLQRHVLYLGEINGSQELAWRRSTEGCGAASTYPGPLGGVIPADRSALRYCDTVRMSLRLGLKSCPYRFALEKSSRSAWREQVGSCVWPR